MAGFITPDTIVDRVVALLRAYLATEIGRIDTTNNAIAGSGVDNNFTTPTIASADIQSYVDRLKGRPLRVVVTDEGSRTLREYQLFGLADGAADTDASLPRLDQNTRIGISVRAAAAGGAQTTAGGTATDHARRVCNRAAEACKVLMYRYPRLSIPTTATAVLSGVVGLDLSSDSRAGEVEEDALHYYRRDLEFNVRTIEGRA